MYPKSAIKNLNLRRAMQVRMEFARKRLVETVFELPFARKTLASLPRGMEPPPDWALNAACLVSDRWLAPVTKLTPEAIREDPRGVLQELMGMFEAMVLYLSNVTQDIPEETVKNSNSWAKSRHVWRQSGSSIIWKRSSELWTFTCPNQRTRN
jgi:hypothetical protein